MMLDKKAIEWNRVSCCENCGSIVYYESPEMKISHRRYRMCRKCMCELAESIDSTLNEEKRL